MIERTDGRLRRGVGDMGVRIHGGDLVEGDALAISAAPGLRARVFPLEGHDIRLMDELNTTAWRAQPPE